MICNLVGVLAALLVTILLAIHKENWDLGDTLIYLLLILYELVLFQGIVFFVLTKRKQERAARRAAMVGGEEGAE